MTSRRLTSVDQVGRGVRRPAYDPDHHGAGIVHIGVGAFHKAHQAVYTDDALAASGGDWRIIGVSLRNPDAADDLNPQNGLYSILENGPDAGPARIIASIAKVIPAPQNRLRLLDCLADPAIKIVSLTVTEKGYGIDRNTGDADPNNPVVAADLARPDIPSGVLGILVAGLARRKRDGTKPYTVLCCDNLPDNGATLRGGVVGFANRIDPALGHWIAQNVAFPSTMVDRITPATTPATQSRAQSLIGVDDHAAVETEPFSQWVIEDVFPIGRPDWAAGGAIFVTEVAPYENMKLWMLNGAHSMLAYAGFLSGQRYVSDVMNHPDLASLVHRHIAAAAGTLGQLSGIRLDEYAVSLAQRFANRDLAHEAYQIAMDGTEKLPQRIFQPALMAQTQGQSLRPFAFATAVWMRYCMGCLDSGETYDLRDPRSVEISTGLGGRNTAFAIAEFLFGLDAFCPQLLLQDEVWVGTVVSILSDILELGMPRALRRESTMA